MEILPVEEAFSSAVELMGSRAQRNNSSLKGEEKYSFGFEFVAII